MRVAVHTLAAKLGVPPTERAVTAALSQHAEDADHAAFMARHFPRIAASTPTAANEKRAAMVRADEAARRDPFLRPGSIRPVAVPPAAASSTGSTTPLPGLGAGPSFGRPNEVRSQGRPFFTRA
jgi:hypothetical protein